jgi:hypothetical protein
LVAELYTCESHPILFGKLSAFCWTGKIWGLYDAGYGGSLVVEGTVNVSGATFGIQAVGQFLRSNPSLILAIFLFEILG